jgi:Protein of unknown function (DUF1553)/Protein of unknown function (DUF1549)/Planctomycete cytochrome C/Concanavalin A-like lectin/glucanases superfamily
VSLGAGTPLAVLAGFLALGGCGVGDRGGDVDYNWDVRPLLSNNCFSCHGPDDDARKAGLRLDLRESAVAELPESPGHVAIAPGDPATSELLRRVSSDDPDVVMPPPSTHLTLAAADIDVLRRWIDQGAQYKPHWSFIAPTDVTAPESQFSAAAINPIDDFVFAGIQEHGLRPAGDADRETLIGRVTFTLTGLPPTPEEVDAFVADSDANAYEKLVDRLLASPAYGERMATEWLDAARFADSDGYLDDEYKRLLYPWRDWVIEAFNTNMPYDRFGTVQLAGDLLDHPSKQDLIASGFGRLHRRTAENGIIDEEYRVEYVIDRTDTLGTAFLGLSVGCARCHDHKFDPISHVDYYSLTAFFNSTDDAGFYPQEKWETGPTMYLTDEQTDRRIEALRAAVDTASAVYETTLNEAEMRLTADPQALAERVRGGKALGEIQDALDAAEVAHYPFDTAAADTSAASVYAGAAGLEPSQPLAFSPAEQPGLKPAVLQAPLLRPGVHGNALFFDANNKGFLDKADGVGYFDHQDSFSIDFWLYTAKVYDEAVVLNHDDHLRFGSGGWTIDLDDNHIKIELVHAYPREQIVVVSDDSLPADAWTHLSITYDGSARADGVDLYVNGTPADLIVERDGLTKSMLPLGIPFAGLDDFHGLAFGKRWQRSPLEGGAIDELRVFAAELSPLEVAVLHDGAKAMDRTDTADRLARHLALLAPETRQARQEATGVRAELNSLLTSLPEVMIMGDTPEPRPTYVLERGVYSNHGEEVGPRGLVQIFPYPETLPKNRAGLAKWLFDPQHPLTARVYVNRLWQLHFGTGLVRTTEEFGAQGEAPSHPELLDWLARRFVDSGWDIKAMNKLIVMSAAFRRDSTERAEDVETDPDNRWLARGVARRLSAEMIRDNALAASGLLDATIGGPSVFPYQPSGVWEAINFYDRSGGYPDPETVPNDQHRRSLYSMIRRGAPVPSMTIFDFPRRHTSQVRRPTSNTPLQALVLLNDPQYVEASRALAARAMHAHAGLDAQLILMFRLAARRTPSAGELDMLRDFFAGQHAEFAASAEATERYLDIGVLEPEPDLDAAWLAALGATANVVFNSPDSYMLR